MEDKYTELLLDEERLAETIRKAIEGNSAAKRDLLKALRDARVFIVRGDEIDVEATLAAIVYWTTNGIEPDVWGRDMVVPVSVSQALLTDLVRYDPCDDQRPLTPGSIWDDVWEMDTADPPELVPGVWYGLQHGHISGTKFEVMQTALAMMEGQRWFALEAAIAAMKSDPDGWERARKAVERRRVSRRPNKPDPPSYPPTDPSPSRSPTKSNPPTPPGIASADELNATLIRKFLLQVYDREDLIKLCHDLAWQYRDRSVEFDALRGESLATKAMYLIDWHRRRDQLEKFVMHIKSQHLAQWNEFFLQQPSGRRQVRVDVTITG